ncbi:MAG: hypothetical protein MJE68_33925 [Proteobacteria bacterium]|nr:hypothetical protein [Pseudomonadota bacterium]
MTGILASAYDPPTTATITSPACIQPNLLFPLRPSSYKHRNRRQIPSIRPQMHRPILGHADAPVPFGGLPAGAPAG